MKTLRQDLVRATCIWLESVLHWNGIAETERFAYSIQCEVKERAAFNESIRSKPYSQLQQQKFQAQEKDFPENLRAVHRAHETLAHARCIREQPLLIGCMLEEPSIFQVVEGLGKLRLQFP